MYLPEVQYGLPKITPSRHLTLMVFLKEFFKKDDFEKNQRMTKKS